MFSVITNIYNKKTKGPTLMELFTATGKLEKFHTRTAVHETLNFRYPCGRKQWYLPWLI
jgi:hypothetical protein